MKNYNRWFSKLSRDAKESQTQVYLGTMMKSHDGRVAIHANRRVKEAAENYDPSDLARPLITGWTIGGVFIDGPRVFCPTADEYNALARTEIAVRLEDYRQPYPVMVIEIPPGTGFPVDPNYGTGELVFARLDRENRVIGTVFVGDGPGFLMNTMAWTADSEDVVEDRLMRRFPTDAALWTSEDAREVSKSHWRAAMNACLLLATYGCRSLGKDNPEYAARLEAKLRKKGVPEAVREQNRRALRMIPERVVIDQAIRIFNREVVRPEPGDPTGRTVRPHWRRGHWANVAAGPGRAERRRVFRAATMVHPEGLAGHAPAVVLTTG